MDRTQLPEGLLTVTFDDDTIVLRLEALGGGDDGQVVNRYWLDKQTAVDLALQLLGAACEL